jgi:hypothetical protein
MSFSFPSCVNAHHHSFPPAGVTQRKRFPLSLMRYAFSLALALRISKSVSGIFYLLKTSLPKVPPDRKEDTPRNTPVALGFHSTALNGKIHRIPYFVGFCLDYWTSSNDAELIYGGQ